MESKLIYIKNARLKSIIDWINVGDSEWIYFGAGEEINQSIVTENINRYFFENDLYVAYTRTGSFQTTKENALKSIEHLLGKEDFSIWNHSFNDIIDFNKIGVLRRGKI